jgi:TPR repeat protein
MLPQSNTKVFLWARCTVEAGLAKAMYAVGHFLKVGISALVNPRECVRRRAYACGLAADGVQVRRVVCT